MGDKGWPPVKLVTTTDNFTVMTLLIDELDNEFDTELAGELDIMLEDIAELLDRTGGLGFFLSSPPQAVRSRLTKSADNTIGIFFIAFTYCTVTVTRATGFSQR